MLIGVMGDIHGNIDALLALHSQFKRLAVNRILCTGDVVGYGGAPGECINFMRKHEIPCVCGNHDVYTIHPEVGNRGIREEAIEVFAWNRLVLDEGQKEWLASLPMVLESNNYHYQVRHASCQPFPSWEYVINEQRASLHFLFQQSKICFNGHSHVPVLGMHRPGRRVTFSRLRNMILPTDYSIMIGVGAVGQPRDGDARACGIVYDTEEHSVMVVRVEYDVEKAQRRILEAGLPEFLATRLSVGK